MKSPPFGYVTPTRVADAVEMLSSDPDARPLAGGQSLLPLLGVRLAAPSLLVDLERIPELSGIEPNGSSTRIGAMTRQAAAERSTILQTQFPLLVDGLGQIGYPAIRNRGTIGGSLAHADPAAELPVLATALDASIIVHGTRGERSVRAEDFFLGPFEVDLRPDELLTFVDLPASTLNWTFLELSRREADFAVVMVAVGVEMDGPRCMQARVVVGGAHPTPIRILAAEQAMSGAEVDRELADDIARRAAEQLRPGSDIHGSAEYRRQVAGVLIRRAVLHATGSRS